MQHLNERNVFTKTITIIQIMNEMCTWTNLVHRTNIGISPLCDSSCDNVHCYYSLFRVPPLPFQLNLNCNKVIAVIAIR